MLSTAANAYKQNRNATATPGELLLALYDGLFRFMNQAKVCFEHGERARAGELLSKAHAILSELFIALDHQVAPELCEQLSSLYEFCMDRVTQANLKGEVVYVDEAIRVLTPLRDAWRQAVPIAHKEQAASRR
jgi:flagellar protein FliS